MTELQFVNVQGSKDQQRKNQTLVRAHAMHVVQSRRRAAKRQKSQAAGEAAQAEATSRFIYGVQTVARYSPSVGNSTSKASPAPSYWSRTQPYPGWFQQEEVPDLASLQSTVTHEFARNTSLEYLNQLVKNSYGRRVTQTDISCLEVGLVGDGYAAKENALRTGWLPALKSSEAMFHASMFIASANLELLSGQALSAVSYFHRGKAIRQVNMELDDNARMMSDSTIGAVVALAGFECLTGNIVGLRHHIKAFTRMIDMREGMQQYGLQGWIGKLSVVYECLLYVYSKQEVRTPHRTPSKRPPHLLINMENELFTLRKPKSNQAIPIEASMLRLFTVLGNLANVFDASFRRQDPTHNADAFTSGCNLALQEISIAQGLSKKQIEGYDAVYECLGKATLMYCCRGSVNGPSILLLQGLNAQTLRQRLETTNLLGYWFPYPGALIWCLLVGSTDHATHADQLWFVSQLLRVLIGLSMDFWEELDYSLPVFAWLVNCSQRRALLER
ncbi:hypothetical protein V501_00807 [Pseudogymnoascus sp. VKM F-4519 (FW-2642)]|nr:hypothetical protein V501_00807 [Pseudogymnoascus sp. VKM F-4519 (FW-2642)]